MWFSPIGLKLVPTDDTLSFRTMVEGSTGLPLPPHPGAFGVQRKNHVHEGVDLYCAEGETVFAVETGRVVSILPFTGEHADSPWWLDTWAVMVEGASGVVLYGEIIPDPKLLFEDEIVRGQPLGVVTRVLRNDKGRPMTMLHLELHIHGTTDAYEWLADRPASLLDPTPHLMELIAPRTHINLTCPSCGNAQQKSNVVSGDKFAWRCEACLGVFEGDTPHALQESARFVDKTAADANVCVGMGGLFGEVPHRIVK